jgi:nitrogen regulatory protein PII
MKRVEIIANRSVQEDILDALEPRIPGFTYTLIPVVHGRGKNNYRLGTATWPEENFIIIAYLDDDIVPSAEEAVKTVKEKHPGEGIKLFIVPALQGLTGPGGEGTDTP